MKRFSSQKKPGKKATFKGPRQSRQAVPPESSTYKFEPLNPWLMCGPDTTVTELWKVRERRDKETRYHLVYFDRYGWYCEHGAACEAVAEVRRIVRTVRTMSADSPRRRSTGDAGKR
ncbi:MAG: hypothetical protein ABI338_02435, partial [Gemmatimonadaceae bacterium]